MRKTAKRTKPRTRRFTARAKQQMVQQIHPGLNKRVAIADFIKLRDSVQCDNIADIRPRNRFGSNFVDFFTMSRRLATVGKEGISFYEFWSRKSEYKKKRYIQNILDSYKERGSNQNELQIFWRIFSLYFGAITIFKSVISMNVYCRYKPTSVLDMTMGWGGRLVGCAALNIPKYTGIDLNTRLERPYEEMVAALKPYSTTKFDLRFKSALDVDYSKIDYDLVLTSPPYYNTEQYEGQPVMDKDTWDSEFYTPLFERTWKHLKRGGHYCLNIPAEIYERVAKKVLGPADELLPMPKGQRTKDEKYKEYIYVWDKGIRG
jgi:hypothetical protein